MNFLIYSAILYLTVMIVTGFIKTVLTHEPADPTELKQDETIEFIQPIISIQEIKPSRVAAKTMTASAAKMVIQVETGSENDELTKLKEEAKQLKIKGYNLYKKAETLRKKIKEVKEKI